MRKGGEGGGPKVSQSSVVRRAAMEINDPVDSKAFVLAPSFESCGGVDCKAFGLLVGMELSLGRAALGLKEHLLAV